MSSVSVSFRCLLKCNTGLCQKKDFFKFFLKQKQKGKNTADIINNIRNIRQNIQEWKQSWLREVILFDDEINQIQNDYGSYVPGCQYYSAGIDDVKDNFFLYEGNINEKKLESGYPLGIDVDSKIKAYVAKYWGAGDVERLINLLDNAYLCDYKKRIKNIN